MQAKSSRGRHLNTNFISLLLQNQAKYILQLQLQLSLDILSQYPDLQPTARLAGSSILSVDVSGSTIYSLIKHPVYTSDNCILAYYNLTDISLKLKENKPIEIHLKQLHKFDEDVTLNVIIAANSATVLVLHGQKFVPGGQVREFMLRRNRRNNMKIYNIYGNQVFDSVSTANSTRNRYVSTEYGQFTTQRPHLAGGVSCSIFVNQNNGNFLCFSFKTVEKNPQTHKVLLGV